MTVITNTAPLTHAENERVAREHFRNDPHEGPLVACYFIDDNQYLVLARPGHGIDRELASLATVDGTTDRVMEYVDSLAYNYSFDNLLIRDLAVFNGRVS